MSNLTLSHLFHRKFHPHLEKRAIIEIIGLILLGIVAYMQRSTIIEAIETVSSIDMYWFVLLLASYWAAMPLTIVNYRLITPKPKKYNFFHAILAHAAGSGPGKMIPGGIGNLSISALHLKKTGLTIEQAIAVVFTNNITGMLTSVLLFISVAIIKPNFSDYFTNNITFEHLWLGLAILIIIAFVIELALHARGTRKEAHKVINQLRKVVAGFISRPKNILGVILISLIITLIHVMMIDLSAFALGLEMNIQDAFIALTIGVFIGGIIPTPGGIGGVEAGITAGLIALGYDAAHATSIAFLFRIASYWQPIVPGIFAYLYLREKRLL